MNLNLNLKIPMRIRYWDYGVQEKKGKKREKKREKTKKKRILWDSKNHVLIQILILCQL